MVTGADRLCDVLLANGINVCFANPGTSEMHFVAALDRRPEMRCILGLFEGVVTGAADGYARATRRPAAVLLHTGPGLANGLANMHNARRSRLPMVVIVGDHASYHLKYDPPLATDIESLAGPMSDWVGRIAGPEDIGPAAQAAIDAAIGLNGIATLILPADASWGEVTRPMEPPGRATRHAVGKAVIADIAGKLSRAGTRSALLLGQDAAIGEPLVAMARVAAATGAQILNEVFVARTERGAGAPLAKRIPYPIEQARDALARIELLVLVGAREPVSFFAYPGKPGWLLPDGCEIVTLAGRSDDQAQAARDLSAALGATAAPYPVLPLARVEPQASGTLTDDAISELLAWHLPGRAFVVSEAATSAHNFERLARTAAAHDFVGHTSGGAIGAGMPTATGVAVGAPDRKVICLQADGCGMYTVQSLWTQARENLDVLTVVYSNRRYAILEIEMANLGLGRPQGNARRVMELDGPSLDWVALARGMGVDAASATTVEAFRDALLEGLSRKGPYLIECMI